MINDRSRTLRCGATTSLTAVEEMKLRVVSGNVPAAEAVLTCETAIGHDGSHTAFAATSENDELWWWLLWGGHTREVRQIDLCEARSLNDPYRDDCLLPEGHPGRHSYELRNA
jgi:hypothetical protein